MDPRTGEIFEFENEEARKLFEKNLGHELIPLTEDQAKKLRPILPKRRIKFLLKGNPCVCGSGKSFKKCCWKKYKKDLQPKKK